MAASKGVGVRVNLPGNLPDGIEPTLHVFDTNGTHVTSEVIPKDGTTKLDIPDELRGVPLRFVTAPMDQEKPALRELRKVASEERVLSIGIERDLTLDIADNIVRDWILCFCTVRGRVVKAVSQPSGSSVDYPVCHARVHICEVDKIPQIVATLPDHVLDRLRDELLVDPIPDPIPDPIGPVIRNPIPRLPEPWPPVQTMSMARSDMAIQRRAMESPRTQEMADLAAAPVSAPAEMRASLAYANLRYAADRPMIREALLDLSILYPWWCWFPWLDRWFRYRVDCNWMTMTDEDGRFSVSFLHPCNDQPDIYIWVEQFIGGSWTTIHARGPRCGTRWNYDCGTEITVRVTHPDARVCPPPPNIEPPDGITTWVLPMAVGNLEIAGQGSHPGDPFGWVQSDGTVSYAGAGVPDNIDPVTDAPLGGYLRFRMLHSLNLPGSGMTHYRWSYRPKPSPDPTVPGGWTTMDEVVTRRYQVNTPSGPTFPAYTLGPDSNDLFAFRPGSPPSGVWPMTGFSEDLWSAKLDSRDLANGLYQVRVTVHDSTGAVVAPSSGTFSFVATDDRLAGETYATRPASAGELIDDGFVFDALIDNGVCTGVLYPVSTDAGAMADACGFLRYANKATTDVTLAFEASHPDNRAWFTLDLVRGMTDLDRVEVGDGGLVGALSVPVDSNGPIPAADDAFYTGDGAGNFSGTFKAARFLDACDNAAFSTVLHVRAKAHDGMQRIHAYDQSRVMAFALAEQPPTP